MAGSPIKITPNTACLGDGKTQHRVQLLKITTVDSCQVSFQLDKMAPVLFKAAFHKLTLNSTDYKMGSLVCQST